MLVRRWWECAGLQPAALRLAAEQFGVREHRMKRLPKIGDVTYWNDSKSTNFAACLGALENFSEPVIWIGGGKNRYQDVDDFARAVAPRIRQAYVIGEISAQLAARLQARGVPTQPCATVQDAVQAAHATARRGDHVVFSPGFSSQDFFRSYVERGTAFENSVLGLRGFAAGQ
jgi:UDP-N-acetylmuramoylalanine--D-glutamate ligase